MKKSILTISLFILCAFFAKQAFSYETSLSGATMGTTYNIKVITDGPISRSELRNDIDRKLRGINKSMSTFDKKSEISRFNSLNRTDFGFKITNDFYRVIKIGEKLYHETEGSWDGTIAPLVDLWGFGPSRSSKEVPEKMAVENSLKRTGFRNIGISDDGFLTKIIPDITLDLASIAKGYGVDQVSDLLLDRGIRSFIVEIGGEVYASGTKKDGSSWRIGINTPRVNSSVNAVFRVIPLSDMAMATSGDYRNYFESNGVRYSHIISPVSGYPVENNIVSATVISKSCAYADGLATAIMVMGELEGIRLVDSLKGVEALIIVKKNKRLTIATSKNFPGFVN